MVSRHRLTMEGEDSAQVLVRFADGSVGNIVTSWAYQLPATTERVSVVAEKGTLWGDGTTLNHRVDDTTTT
jgi:predicted dehydrogenase